MDREPDWPLSWFLIPKDWPGARRLARHWRSCLLASLLLQLLICGALTSIVSLLGESELPARAQARLDEYLAYVFPGEEIAVAAIDRAVHPSELTADLAGLSFGSSVHFQTDLGASDLDEGGLSPLPFPPAEVWCVLLEGEGPPPGRVAFVAKYLDLYTGDWIVHPGPADAASVEAHHLLSTLGCSLVPEPEDFNALDRVKKNGQRGYAFTGPAIFA